jgi:hypothetical protein
MQKEPFTIAVPEETLSDLRDRLVKTRWPHDFANASGSTARISPISKSWWTIGFTATTGANTSGR